MEYEERESEFDIEDEDKDIDDKDLPQGHTSFILSLNIEFIYFIIKYRIHLF